MNDIELLRKAAALMRERARVASEGRWAIEHDPGYVSPRIVPLGHTVVESVDPSVIFPEAAEHIAGMDPTVALVVADWLKKVATDLDEWVDDGGCPCLVSDSMHRALAVARAYLREEE